MRFERRKVRRRKKRESTFKRFLKGLSWTFFSLFIIGVVTAIGLFFYFKDDVFALYEEANRKVESINEGTFKNKTETVIYDNKGNVIKELAVHDYYYIEDKDIKPEIKNAVIAIEDERFMEHKGYDLKAIARAGVQLIKNKGEITQGGSTITQQLVKVQFLTLEKSYKRKIEEIFIAAKLEEKYSKEQILEFYLNNINYGNGAYGIETASRTYFNKPSKELTISESAFLTAIPNNPSVYNPVRNMENTLKRRDLILSKMKEHSFITEAQYQEAKSQEIKLNMPEKVYKPETYEVSYAISSATKQLMKNEGFTFKYSFKSDAERKKYEKEYNDLFLQLNQKIRNGGYSIYTTIDMEKQKLLQETVNQQLSGYYAKNSESGIYKMQGAAVTIDNKTGDLLAIVGGRTQDDVANTFNRAFLSHRQPGSTIKPLVAYTPAFEKGKLASSVMTDKPIKNGPQNAGRNYRGAVTLREAVERSINTIPFQLVANYGPKEMLEYLEEMQFGNLVKDDENAGIAVGGFTYGTNPLEMAGAYSTLARNGEYIEPTGIKKIIDVTKTVLYVNEHKKKRVYDSGSSYLMTDVLKGVLTESRGTGKGYALSNMTAAAKTGTTNDNKDSWMAGYTPYFTTVVWVGEDTPRAIYDTAASKRIWKQYMDKIHKGLEKKDFTKPERISYMYVNPNTGEVDKKDNHGWWRKELVPEIYYELQEKAKAEAEAKRKEELRKAEEKKRLEEERKAEERRKELERYGVTEEEEMMLEEVASDAVAQLERVSIQNEYDIERAEELKMAAEMAIENVKLPDSRDVLYNRYQKQVKRLDAEQYEYEHPEPIVLPEPQEEKEEPQTESKYKPSEPKYQPDKPKSSQPKEDTPKETKPSTPKEEDDVKEEEPTTPKPKPSEPVTPTPETPKEEEPVEPTTPEPTDSNEDTGIQIITKR